MTIVIIYGGRSHFFREYVMTVFRIYCAVKCSNIEAAPLA